MIDEPTHHPGWSSVAGTSNRISLALLSDESPTSQEDKYEADEIINEEQLLEQEVSVYFSLQSMLAGIEPFHKLWHIALDFYTGYEIW